MEKVSVCGLQKHKQKISFMWKSFKPMIIPVVLVATVVAIAVIAVVTKKNADGSRTVKANLFTDKKAAA